MRGGDERLLDAGPAGLRGESQRPGRRRDRLPVRVPDRADDSHRLRGGAVVADQSLHDQGAVPGGPHLRGQIEARGGVVGRVNVDRRGLQQPGMAVQAAVDVVELVAAAGGQAVGGVFGVRVAFHRQHVVPVEGRRRCPIEDEPRESAPVLPQADAVQVDVGDGRGPFEVQEDLPPPIRLPQREMGAIPGGPVRPHIGSEIPGVGDGDGLPGVVVEARLLDVRPARLAREAPGSVERNLLPPGHGRGGLGDRRRGLGGDAERREQQQGKQEEGMEQRLERGSVVHG